MFTSPNIAKVLRDQTLNAPGQTAQQQTGDHHRLLTINEVADWLGVSKAWVYDHVTRKRPFTPCVASVNSRDFGRLRSNSSFKSTRNAMALLDLNQLELICSSGFSMGRDRYQEGRVVLVGKRLKKWRGHFYLYQKRADGSEIRRHRNVCLGFKAEMDKGQAKAKLREIISRETRDVTPASVAVTLRWFYENRFLPQKEQQWKMTSRPKTKRFIENYLLKRFGETLLGNLDKFTLQTYLNEMAPGYSKSVLAKIRVYLNSMLDEAVELEFLVKNPAAKLAVPRSGKRSATKHLTPEQIPQILFHLSDRDRLIVRMFLVLGLRPGEMFALRWNDKQGNSLRIDSSITEGIEVETKTEDSDSFVWIPASIDTELEFWRSACRNASPDAFIFGSSLGTAINTNNFLFRVLKEAGREAGIDGITHQMLRRTCSTYMAQLTNVKDVQAHLRHANAKTTLEHYIKSVPETVRVAVESLDQLLKSSPGASGKPPN